MEKREAALEVLAAVSGADGESLRPDMDLVADLGIDSLKALRLLVELEDRFDVEINDEDATRISTVGDVLDYVAGLEA